jgi:TonB family protein
MVSRPKLAGNQVFRMSILKPVVPKPSRLLMPSLQPHTGDDRRQRGLMLGSLCLLLFAFSIVVWHNRDFWFPDSDADSDADQPIENSLVITPPRSQPTAEAQQPEVFSAVKSKHKAIHTAARVQSVAPAAAPESQDPPPVVTTRTVLPPLDVEVVAGNKHQILRPGSNSLHVEMEPDAPGQAAPEASTQPAANITVNAAERVQMSADTSTVVTHTVKPSYPLLAKQMKVQGSVILRALVGKDGVIQNLRVVSGPPILSSAAEDAVRQWHFKPHLENNEAVETEARITVNFTISMN